MTLSYLDVLNKIKTDVWDTYSGSSSNFSSDIAVQYNFYSWLCSDTSAFSTYDSPLDFANELMKLTQEIIANDKKQIELDLQLSENNILTEQNNILTEQNNILAIIRDDIHRLRERGDDTHLGIVHRGIHWEAEDCKNKTGIIRMALKDSNLLDSFSRARAEEEYSKIFSDCGD